MEFFGNNFLDISICKVRRQGELLLTDLNLGDDLSLSGDEKY